MKIQVSLWLCVLFFGCCYSQQENTIAVDSLYKEDQFYISVTYNLLGQLPTDVSQNGFSGGFHLGFIKDMPLNKNRNFALGIGIGYSANSFNHNILVNKDNLGDYSYSVLNETETNYSKNKFSSHLIELPLEFRWRTSTPEAYKFWRIYAGFKVGYNLTDTSKFKGESGELSFSNISDFNDWQYGLTLSVGYNILNMFMQYNLNSILSNDAKINGESIDMNAIKIGLIVYIL